jgi:hypothetical protein
MPIEVTFALRALSVPEDAGYINDCCWGGDVIAGRLLPPVKQRYEGVESGQEDWGWYVWITDRDQRLEIDIFCDSHERAEFRVHLVSLRRRRLLPNVVVDLPSLDELKGLVVPILESWSGGRCEVARLEAEGYR